MSTTPAWVWIATAAAGCAVLLCRRPVATGSRPGRRGGVVQTDGRRADVLRHRGVAAALALVAGLTWGHDLLGPVLGPLVGLAAAAAVWTVAGKGESSAQRRAGDRARADLPHLVGLASDALRAGLDPATALRHAAAALPGPAADRVLGHLHALGLGADHAAVWRDLAVDPALAPLGRALSRAHDTGTPVADAVRQLAENLSASSRSDVEDRARRVGVKAAIPLGLCLLPAFVVLGIVPVAATLLGSLW